MWLRRALSFVLLLSVAYATDVATVKELLADAKKFDGKEIKVTAKAFKVERKTSQIGKSYYKLRLGDTKQFLYVYGRGQLDQSIRNDDTVEAIGVYVLYKDAVPPHMELDCTPKVGAKRGVRKVDPAHESESDPHRAVKY